MALHDCEFVTGIPKMESRETTFNSLGSVCVCVISLYTREFESLRERLWLIPGKKITLIRPGKQEKCFIFIFLSAMFYSSKNVKTWSFFHIFFINIQPECHPHGVGGNTDELLLDGCVGGGCHWEEHQVGGGRVVVPFTFPIITHRDACYKYKWSFLSLFYPLNEKRRWVQPTKGRPPISLVSSCCWLNT